MENLDNYLQKTSQGCLVVCLMLLTNKPSKESIELKILNKGLRLKDSYALGVINAFVKEFKIKVNVYIEDQAFKSYLQSKVDPYYIEFKSRKIDLILLQKMKKPYIVYLDSNIVGTYEHSPHFILVEKSRDSSKTLIIDPWFGNKTQMSQRTIIKGVSLLRDRLKYCPLLITLV